MRILVEPRVVVDKSVEGEEGFVFEMLEGVIVKRRLQGVVGVLDAIKTHELGVLHCLFCTYLYRTQDFSLSISTLQLSCPWADPNANRVLPPNRNDLVMSFANIICNININLYQLPISKPILRSRVLSALHINIMTEPISQNLMLILNSVLLGLCSIVLLFGIYRAALVRGKNKSFLLKFFGIVSIISAIELALQTYQVVELTQSNTITAPILISINIYAMAFEAAAMFTLSDFWGGTSEILTKQSTQEQLQDEKHRVRFSILIVWLIVFSAFIGYAFSTHDIVKENWRFDALVLGCQGLGVCFVIWANMMQIIKGYKMSLALSRYENWVSSLSIHKVQFCFLYWLSSLINLFRSFFLIVITLTFYLVQDNWANYFWLFILIYSFSNIPILLIYLLGFSAQSEQLQLQTILLDDNRSSSKSRRETELSHSRSSKSMEH